MQNVNENERRHNAVSSLVTPQDLLNMFEEEHAGENVCLLLQAV